MGFENIEKKDWFYDFLKKNFVDVTHNKIFYRKVHVFDAEKIPENSHLIFTPNHQNALMDALALLCNVDQQLVFLARSDIFKKKFIAAILYFLKILPIFRIRDGYSSVKKNRDIFQKTVDVINAGNGLVILPEGNHEGKHTLRPLKKGFARIAFQTEEANDFKLNIHIVPVGLHYSDYIKARSDLFIVFGDPIPVSGYTDLYHDNPAVAINRITADLAEKIKPLMVHIASKDHYDTYDSLRLFYWEKMAGKNHLENRVLAEQTVIDLVEQFEKYNPKSFIKLKELVEAYNNALKANGISDMFFRKQQSFGKLLLDTVLFLLGLPVLVYSLIVNLLPILIVKSVVGKIQDPQFKSSVKYVLALVIFPLFYLIEALTGLIILKPVWTGLIFTISLPMAGMFTYFYFHRFRKYRASAKVWIRKHFNKKAFGKMQSARVKLDQMFDEIMGN